MDSVTHARPFYLRLLVSFLIIFLIIGVSLSVALTLVHYHQFQQHIESQQHKEQLRLELGRKIVQRNLRQRLIDLQMLAESEISKRYLDNPNHQNAAELATAFSVLAKQTGMYDQIRFIDQHGREQLRINYSDGFVHSVPAHQLQDKSDRYYFLDSVILPPGHIYISALDLNIEKGKLEIPYKAMLRIATPLYINGAKDASGILILNHRADHILFAYEDVMLESWGTAKMLNQAGAWIYSIRDNQKWRALRHEKDSFATLYPAAWKSMVLKDTGHTRTHDGLFLFTRIHLTQNGTLPISKIKSREAFWYLTSHINPNTLTFSIMQTIAGHQKEAVALVIFTGMLSALLAWLRTTLADKSRALRESQALHRNLFDNMADGYALHEAMVDKNGKVFDFRYLDVNPAFERILGVKRTNTVGSTILNLFPDTESYWIDSFARVATTGKAERLEQFSALYYRYFEVTAASPSYGLVAVLFTDVSDRKRAEEKQRQVSAVFDNTLEAIMVTDRKQNIIAVNQAYTKITGYSQEDVIGKTPRLHQSGYHEGAFYKRLWRSLAETGQWQGEIWNKRKDGEVYPAWENISTVRDETGKVSNYVSIFSDISAIKDAERRLSELAFSDTLTGLNNRLAFSNTLEQALQRANRRKRKIALLFLDLDRFKLINDTLGHDAGDMLLKKIAQRLKLCVRAEDTVARIGGDEFIVLVEGIVHSEDASLLAKKIISSVSEPVRLNTQEIVTSASVGVCIYPDDANTIQKLFKAADTAMYRAKAHGRNTFEFYTNDMTVNAMQRLTTENQLRLALRNQELRLHYQPQMDVSTGELCGVEALLRWHHPTLGLLLPDKFIDVAEESRLINEIGEWVIHQTFFQTRLWRDAGLPQPRIAINLSPQQIVYDNIIHNINQALDEHDLTAEEIKIELEITERVLHATEKITETLHALRSMGFTIAIDDFGTGYSSLSLLKHLPIDTVKIDRTFLSSIPNDTDNTAITATIISMGHTLGMRVIAEGIETQEQLDFLKQHSCDEAQGFFFSHALPADEVSSHFIKQISTETQPQVNI